MNDLESEVKKIQLLLKTISSDLDLITQINFSEKIDGIVKNINLLKSKRQLLLSKYEKDELLKFDKELYLPAKQIQKKFDNIVEEYNTQIVEISRKLLQIGNKKKLANYIR